MTRRPTPPRPPGWNRVAAGGSGAGRAANPRPSPADPYAARVDDRPRAHLLAWVGAALLVALHLDSWRPRRAVLWGGWMPEELGYRLLWMALAFAYLLWFCAAVWRPREEDEP